MGRGETMNHFMIRATPKGSNCRIELDGQILENVRSFQLSLDTDGVTKLELVFRNVHVDVEGEVEQVIERMYKP
jgi:hypothetical protein